MVEHPPRSFPQPGCHHYQDHKPIKIMLCFEEICARPETPSATTNAGLWLNNASEKLPAPPTDNWENQSNHLKLIDNLPSSCSATHCDGFCSRPQGLKTTEHYLVALKRNAMLLLIAVMFRDQGTLVAQCPKTKEAFGHNLAESREFNQDPAIR